MAAAFEMRPGLRNLMTDVPGILVGAAHDEAARTGVTVILCADSVAGAVDVRGGGPGTRDTEILAAEGLVGRAHAFVLTGGSALGLSAAEATAEALSARKIGLSLHTGAPHVPIVPAAVIYDLTNGGDKSRCPSIYRELGAAALAGAAEDFALGRSGAGMGARAGLFRGGQGSASIVLGGGLIVGALMIANPVGSVFMPDGNTYWAWPFEIDGEFGGARPGPGVHARAPFPDSGRLRAADKSLLGANTTIGVVATSARLTPAECKRVAMMAQDGIARAVRPAHTPFDGDLIFCASTGRVDLPEEDRHLSIAALGSSAADCVARAVARGVFAAQ